MKFLPIIYGGKRRKMEPPDGNANIVISRICFHLSVVSPPAIPPPSPFVASSAAQGKRREIGDLNQTYPELPVAIRGGTKEPARQRRCRSDGILFLLSRLAALTSSPIFSADRYVRIHPSIDLIGPILFFIRRRLPFDEN